MVPEEEAPEFVLALLDGEAVAEMEEDGGLAEAFARKDAEMGPGHAGVDFEVVFKVAELGEPAPAPANAGVDAERLREVEAEEGEPGGGTAPLVGVEPDAILRVAWPEHDGVGREIALAVLAPERAAQADIDERVFADR